MFWLEEQNVFHLLAILFTSTDSFALSFLVFAVTFLHVSILICPIHPNSFCNLHWQDMMCEVCFLFLISCWWTFQLKIFYFSIFRDFVGFFFYSFSQSDFGSLWNYHDWMMDTAGVASLVTLTKNLSIAV